MGVRLVSILVVIAAVALAVVNLDRMNFNTVSVHRCAAALATGDGPADDVLFVGSSRTGAALDPRYIQSLLRAGGRPDARVDRLITWGSDHVHLNLLLRAYLRHRGPPDRVFLEMTVHEDPGLRRWGTADALPVLDVHSLRYADLADYRDLMADPRLAAASTERLVFLQARHMNSVEFMSAKLVQGLYHFIDNPLGLFRDLDADCSDAARRRDEGRGTGLVFDSLGAPPADPVWRQRAKPVVAPRPPLLATASDEALLYDVTYIRNTARLLKAAGVGRVTLLAVPASTETDPSPAAMARARALFPDVEIVGIADLATRAEREAMRREYRDAAHLTPRGAVVASGVVARLLVDSDG